MLPIKDETDPVTTSSDSASASTGPMCDGSLLRDEEDDSEDEWGAGSGCSGGGVALLVGGGDQKTTLTKMKTTTMKKADNKNKTVSKAMTRWCWGYGGDFGPKQWLNDGPFCMNGLVDADRTLHPGVAEVNKQNPF